RGKSTWSIHVRDENAMNIAGFLKSYKKNFSPNSLFSMKHLFERYSTTRTAVFNTIHGYSQPTIDHYSGFRHRRSPLIQEIDYLAPLFEVYYNSEDRSIPVKEEYLNIIEDFKSTEELFG